MTIKTVAILSPGEMGAATGKAFQAHGFDIITSLDGRSETSREARLLPLGFVTVVQLHLYWLKLISCSLFCPLAMH